jgi:hypothetical protein
MAKVVDPDLNFFRPDREHEAAPFAIGTEVTFEAPRLVAEWDLQHRRWLIPGNRYTIRAFVAGTDGVIVRNEVQQDIIVSWDRFRAIVDQAP